jgi:hypothetical protein
LLSTSAYNDRITITSSHDSVEIDYGIQNVLYSVDLKYKLFKDFSIDLNIDTFKTSSLISGSEFDINFEPIIDLQASSTFTINLPSSFTVASNLDCQIGVT